VGGRGSRGNAVPGRKCGLARAAALAWHKVRGLRREGAGGSAARRGLLCRRPRGEDRRISRGQDIHYGAKERLRRPR
jgi:hypothetical protein